MWNQFSELLASEIASESQENKLIFSEPLQVEEMWNQSSELSKSEKMCNRFFEFLTFETIIFSELSSLKNM